jgi:hypothetical protein
MVASNTIVTKSNFVQLSFLQAHRSERSRDRIAIGNLCGLAGPFKQTCMRMRIFFVL